MKIDFDQRLLFKEIRGLKKDLISNFGNKGYYKISELESCFKDKNNYPHEVNALLASYFLSRESFYEIFDSKLFDYDECKKMLGKTPGESKRSHLDLLGDIVSFFP